MSQQEQDFQKQLDDLLGSGGDDGQLAVLARKYNELKQLRLRVAKEEDAAKREIIALMDSAGLDGVKAGGRHLSFTTKSYYSVAQGESPEQMAENLAEFKRWLDGFAPELNVPASQKIQKAIDTWQDLHPNQPLPEFIHMTEKRSLSNRQA